MRDFSLFSVVYNFFMRQNPDEDSEVKQQQQQQQPQYLKLQLGEKVHISRECKGDCFKLLLINHITDIGQITVFLRLNINLNP